jgi:hypothetical protein
MNHTETHRVSHRISYVVSIVYYVLMWFKLAHFDNRVATILNAPVFETMRAGFFHEIKRLTQFSGTYALQKENSTT